MPNKKRGELTSLVVGLVLVLIASPSRADRDDDNLRRDVLTCEDAISHARDCCGPDAVAGIECRFFDDVDEGCGTTTINHQDPDLYIDESECIRKRSCDELRAGPCAKLKALPRGAMRTSTSTGVSTGKETGNVSAQGHAPVCP